MNKYILKLNKKLGQAISTLVKVEKMSFDQLVSHEETGRFIVVHFGQGTEEDYIGLRKFLHDFGVPEGKFNLDLYPGYSHGFLSLNSIETAKRLNEYVHEYNETHIQFLKEQKEKKQKEKEEKEGQTKIKEDEPVNPQMENIKSSKESKYLMNHINIDFENKERNCFFFNTHLQAEQMKCFSSQNNSLQVATSDYESLLKHGIIVIEDVLTKEEETELLNVIYSHEWENLSHRRVQHYGYKFIYGANTIDRNKMIGHLPEWSTRPFSHPKLVDLYEAVTSSKLPKVVQESLETNSQSIKEIDVKSEEYNLVNLPQQINSRSEIIHDHFKNFSQYFDQLTINEYQPGSGIPPHTDSHAPFEEPLISISLMSDIVILFRNPLTSEEINVLIPARSAFVMTGESRYLWTHAINTRKIDRTESGLSFRRKRVSLTYRKSRPKPCCECPYPNQCDYVQGQKSAIINETIDISKPEFEKRYVKDVYNSIAEHFSHTRYKAWPKVQAFLEGLPSGSIVGDIGCGNGKYIFCVNHLQFIGSDIAENFAKICREKDPKTQVLVSDTINVPFRDSSLDYAISIAVIHHLSTAERRKQAIKELIRVVKPGGRVLIYVWAYEQHDKKFVDQDVFVPWNNQLKFEPKSQSSDIDKNLNEAKQTVVYKRFYHVFKKGELEELVSECKQELSTSLEIKDSYYDHENWCIEILKKPKE
jgi:alkylated DNA repair protein alkB family protein 8